MSVSGPFGSGEIQKPEEPKKDFSRVLSELSEIVDSVGRNTLDDMPNYRAILQTIKMAKQPSTEPPARKAAEDLVFPKTVEKNKSVKVQARRWEGTGDAVTEKHSHEPRPTKKQRRN